MRRAGMALAVAALVCACSPAGEGLGGGRQFRYQERAYLLSCEAVRPALLAAQLGEVQFEDRTIAIRTVDGLDPAQGLAARWPECAQASDPPPWVLAVTRGKDGAPDLAPYGEVLAD